MMKQNQSNKKINLMQVQGRERERERSGGGWNSREERENNNSREISDGCQKLILKLFSKISAKMHAPNQFHSLAYCLQIPIPLAAQQTWPNMMPSHCPVNYNLGILL